MPLAVMAAFSSLVRALREADERLTVMADKPAAARSYELVSSVSTSDCRASVFELSFTPQLRQLLNE